MSNIFEKATRVKLRFPTTRGELSVEDLWELPLKGTLSLNSIAVKLKKEVSSTEDMIDLVDGDAANKESNIKMAKTKLALEVVMHIIGVLKAERDARELREAQQSKLRLIDNALATKRQEQLTSGSIEDLEKLREDILKGTDASL